MRDNRLQILQHSLGLDQYGEGREYRNHFVTGPGSSDYADCCALVEQGLMQNHGPKFSDKDFCFTVTRAGKEYIAHHSPKRPPAPKLTRAQRRYREWLHSESTLAFIDWLRRKNG